MTEALAAVRRSLATFERLARRSDPSASDAWRDISAGLKTLRQIQARNDG